MEVKNGDTFFLLISNIYIYKENLSLSSILYTFYLNLKGFILNIQVFCT